MRSDCIKLRSIRVEILQIMESIVVYMIISLGISAPEYTIPFHRYTPTEKKRNQYIP